ncbi:MAG: hypothetical protein V3T31_12970, partial [candidate division Zixibacteria bacterium]
MTSTRRFALIVLCLIFFFSTANSADIGIQTRITTGSTGNLLKDSTELYDDYTSSAVTLNLYPLSMTELSITTSYTYYQALDELSNLLYSASLSFIPTNDSSDFSFFLNARASRQDYNNEDVDINRNEFASSAYAGLMSAGYKLKPTVHLRAGISFDATGYVDDRVRDKLGWEAFTGLNFSFLGSNSIDIEGGFAFGGYDHLDGGFGDGFIDSMSQANLIDLDTIDIRTISIDSFTTLYGVAQIQDSAYAATSHSLDTAYEGLSSSNLNYIYFSPRFSRPLGSKTGLNITYTHRSFIGEDNAAVFGYSFGLLSPWASIYEGDALSVTIKTLLVPSSIITVGGSYWDKSFLEVVDDSRSVPRRDLKDDPFGIGATPVEDRVFTDDAIVRKDQQTRWF